MNPSSNHYIICATYFWIYISYFSRLVNIMPHYNLMLVWSQRSFLSLVKLLKFPLFLHCIFMVYIPMRRPLENVIIFLSRRRHFMSCGCCLLHYYENIFQNLNSFWKVMSLISRYRYHITSLSYKSWFLWHGMTWYHMMWHITMHQVLCKIWIYFFSQNKTEIIDWIALFW